MELKEILIKDYKENTLISIDELNTSIISISNFFNDNFSFGDIDIEGLIFNLTQYKGETDTNLDIFVARFDSDQVTTTDSNFILSSSDVSVEDGVFSLVNENKETPEVFVFNDLNVNITDFIIDGKEVRTRVNTLSFLSKKGVKVNRLSTNFEYTPEQMIFDALDIETKSSQLKGDLRFDYKREDLQYFTDKVNLTANFKKSKVTLEEINTYFDEFGNNQNVFFDAEISGTLNKLKVKNLELKNNKNTRMIGDIDFENIFTSATDDFKMDADFDNLSTTYDELYGILPKITANSIPEIFKRVGRFSLSGTTIITANEVETISNINTSIGNAKTDLKLSKLKDINNSDYKGNVVFDNFDLGFLLNDPKLGTLTANVDLDGKSFDLNTLKTKATGTVSKLVYNDYQYQKLSLSGTLSNKKFNGDFKSEDPNLKLDFQGLADFSKEIKTLNFKAQADYVNLKKLNFVTRDSVSTITGYFDLDVKGTNIDDVSGRANFKNAIYTNQDNTYNFKDFSVISSFNKNIRTLKVNSPDLVNGKIQGIFKTKDVLKLVENSAGSLYANYDPIELEDGQYIDFDININKTIVTVFDKNLKLSENSRLKGHLESNSDKFNLNFKIPIINYKDDFAKNISISIDNNNPVYNTYVTVDELNTSYYKVNDFNLINTTKRDTLFIKTEFKGGNQSNDDYDLNMFYTINESKKSVIGFKKSNVTFKDYKWLINKEKDTLNKIQFDRDFKTFVFSPFKFNQNTEEIAFSGSITDKNTNNFQLNFNGVELKKITPDIDSLSLSGMVNGNVKLEKSKGVYLPKSNLSIERLNVNRYDLGNLYANIKGNQSITDYKVDVWLQNDNLKTFTVNGNINVEKENSSIDVDVTFEEFLLDPLNPLGEGVISDIRGLVSGDAKVSGSLNKPDITGKLLMDNAGLSIPYLNVGYGFDFDSEVILREQKFIFNNIKLTDSKFFSTANLNGFIEHNNFSDWELGLKLDTDRLLVLNTEDDGESLYYGKGFVSGTADITGPTNELKIIVDGATEKGTEFYVPLNDATSFGDNSYVKFITREEKEARIKGERIIEQKIAGLELDFDLNVNENATVEILIDKENGSTIKGKGSGDLKFLINTEDKFEMYGNVSVINGSYKFKYLDIVEKNFEVQRNGTIAWQGNPLGAELNVNAIYKTRANPSVLLDNPINQSIPIELGITIIGRLDQQPQPDFSFNFPNLTSNVKSELGYRLSSKEDRDNQALMLLVTGGFSNGFNDVSINGTLSERLKGIANSIFGTDPNGNFNVGIDVELGENNVDFQTDNRVGLTLQTKLSDKILVNGKVGVPFGSETQTVIAGDVQIELLLNDDGTLRATVFNRENSIRNFGEEIGYTQGIGLSYNVEFDTFKELLQIIFSGKNKKKKSDIETTEESSESYSPEFVKVKRQKSSN